MSSNEKLMQAFMQFNDVIEKVLDKDGGCPWDKEQTPHSLSEYTIEECFETVDAIRKNLHDQVCDEMGDLLFGIALIVHKYKEQGLFDLADVLNASVAKMHRRHPHVFAENKESLGTSHEELSKTWEAIKKKEKADSGEENKGVFASVPSSLPPLTQAYRIHAKAAKAGFTWDDEEDVERQVEAEWLELLDAKASGDKEAIQNELGDMIFSLTEMGRRMGVKASYAVAMTNNKFLTRFEKMEAFAKERGLNFEELSLDDKDELWEEAKATEKK